MKINIQILYIYALRFMLYVILPKLKKSGRQQPRNDFAKLSENTGFYGSAWNFTLFSPKKLYALKGIN